MNVLAFIPTQEIFCIILILQDFLTVGKQHFIYSAWKNRIQ